MMIGPFRIHTLVAILMALVGIAAFVPLTVRKQKREGRCRRRRLFTLPAGRRATAPTRASIPTTSWRRRLGTAS